MTYISYATDTPKLHNAKVLRFVTKREGLKQIPDTVVLKNKGNYVTLVNRFYELAQWSGKNIVLDIRDVQDEGQKAMIVHLVSRHLYTFGKYNGRAGMNIHIIDNRVNAPIQEAVTIEGYVQKTRHLINEPANVATPKYISNHIIKLFQGTTAHVTVYDDAMIRKMGLNLVHAVGKASVNKPYFVVIEHMGAAATNGKTICLCGKGVTFDAGGLNLKIGEANSWKMKGDKTGACNVIGIMKYVVDVGLAANIVGVIPLVENVISGDVTHPGDIVKSYSGKTVEIINTDAEGRLILADALSFCEKYKPDYIFDMATLTSWALQLHCDTSTVYFTNNEKLRRLIDEVGEQVGERTWAMPKWLEYMEFCNSSVADVKNFGFDIHGCGRGSGYMATMFMAHFVPKGCLNKWVHFDITNTDDSKFINANTMVLVIKLIERIITRT